MDREEKVFLKILWRNNLKISCTLWFCGCSGSKAMVFPCYSLLFQQWHPLSKGLEGLFGVLNLSWQRDNKLMWEKHSGLWDEAGKSNLNMIRSVSYQGWKRSSVWICGFCCWKIRWRWASQRETPEKHQKLRVQESPTRNKLLKKKKRKTWRLKFGPWPSSPPDWGLEITCKFMLGLPDLPWAML